MESDISRHRLCVLCQGINLDDMKSNGGYVHQLTCDALVGSADACDLCKLIVELFTQSIHEHRLATSSIRDISDAWHLGPVRLFAASNEIDLEPHIFQRRERSHVKDRLLSQRVALMLGTVGTELSYGPGYPTLLMFADPGIVTPHASPGLR